MKKIIIIICFLGLAGCLNGTTGSEEWFWDNSKKYVHTKPSTKLKVPKNLKAEPFSDHYAIPQ